MKADHLNPFIQAVNDVFTTMFDTQSEKKSVFIKEDMVSSNEANVLLNVTGDLEGTILFGFPKKMTFEMIRNMSGMEMTEINSFVASALGEVANIISGNAMTILHESDVVCDILPPKVMVGEYQTFSKKEEKIIALTMATDFGEFDLNLMLEEQNERKSK
ncbi:chemotaxis protein CheX [Tindallia magadiensis]|uniref:Chemotaxis protein CheX n=1 Tax=Tindallia magadiensis TaxID=69895 RepID=A0A1I3H2A9_9FIRM|nr:chemotaxis protein CheX [Tindallia magadiensis]SFI29978.1 chemotaxis protein CheX [Tindallia magadiensis]